MPSSLCRRCGTPTTDLGLRSDALFCTAACRGRFHIERNRALIDNVFAQGRAIDAADFGKLEALIVEARAIAGV